MELHILKNINFLRPKYYYNKFFELNQIKRKFTLNQGFDFLFIIDRNYSELELSIK